MQIELMNERNMADVLAVFRSLNYDDTVDAKWFDRCTNGDSTCPADLRLVARCGQEIVAFIIGSIRDGDLLVKLIAVYPSHRRRGIGSALLQKLEKRALQRRCGRAQVGGIGPNYFYPGVDLVFTPALSFFWKHGYRTDRVAMVDMQVDLANTDLAVAGDCARLEHDGIRIARVAVDELNAVTSLGGNYSEAWRQELVTAGMNEPISVFAAFVEGEPIAFAVYGVTGYQRFGPTLTEPAYRHRGIGGVLLKLCLAAIKEQGWPSAEISWAGPVQYYARTVGARIHKAYWAYTKELSS